MVGPWVLMPFVLMAQGQQGSGSPYSAYGLGELSGNSQVSQATMGGLGVAVVDPFSVVSINPASYAMLKQTTFEQGLVVRSSQYSTNTADGFGSRVDILGLSVGVPFGRGKWGIGLGISPVSNVGYRISDQQTLPGNGGQVTYLYEGDGGLNRAYFGAGLVVSEVRDSLNNGHRLSVGANLGYVFGSIEETSKAIYPVNRGYYNTNVFSTLILRDPVANAGVHFQGDLRPRRTASDDGLHYLVGATVELPSTIGARRSDLVTSFGIGATGVEFPIDTIYFADGTPGSLGLPLGLGFGVTLFNVHWTVSAEVKHRDWSQLRVEVEGYELPSTLASSTSYILGASFRPAKERGGSFWQRTTYRAGVRYNEDYLVVEDNQLQEIGMSFGMSLPVMGSSTRSRLNFGVELGERGTTDDGLVQERFGAWYIGLTITPDIREQWFTKRRIE